MNQVIQLINQLGGVLLVEGVVNGKVIRHYLVGDKTVELVMGPHKPQLRPR